MDKRIVRTRLAVFNALFDLATEKEIDKITVVELCERAGINKSTFYLHYRSINDCFQKCFDLFTEKMLEFSKDIVYEDMGTAPEKTIATILDATEKNMVYVERFRDSVMYDSAIRTVKEAFVNEILKKNNIDPTVNYHEAAKVTFLVGGCADMIMRFSPNFNRAEIEKIMVDVIKRK